MRRLRFLEEAQWWDQERLASYQDEALSSLIRVAYHDVPFYRRLLDDAGIESASIRRRQDLMRLPIVTKQQLRAGYPHSTTRSTGQKPYEVSSSGSTGTNFRVQEDAETAGIHRAAFLLALEWSGWQVGEPHLQTGITLNRSVDRRLKDFLLRCHYVSAYDLTDANLDAALRVLDGDRIRHLWGYPGSLYCLAQRAIQAGWNRPLRAVVTWGDNLYAHYRETIERAFTARVFDTYGCGEGIQIAAQCGEGNTYHIHTPDVIVDCLDDAGRPVAPGQLGNLIVTRLHPGPMPLIRYQIGDVGVIGARRCRCGRGYDVMESIQGRDTDLVMTPGGNRLVVHFFTGILEHIPEIDCFQVIQDELEAIVVRVVPSNGVSRFSNETAKTIVSRLRQSGTDDLKITVEPVAEIPVSPSGKRRFVIASRSRDRAPVPHPQETQVH
jgi:phenylacetate-CoA ligase